MIASRMSSPGTFNLQVMQLAVAKEPTEVKTRTCVSAIRNAIYYPFYPRRDARLRNLKRGNALKLNQHDLSSKIDKYRGTGSGHLGLLLIDAE